MENYYEDNSHVSNSMLNNLVKLTKSGKKYHTPDIYYNMHVANTIGRLEQTSPMKVGSIVDEYFADGVDVFEKYTVISKTTKAGKEAFAANPELCISGAEQARIELLINALASDKAFSDLIKHPDLNSQPIYKGEYNGIKMKGKFDFDLPGKIIDLKTTGNFEMLIDDMQWDLIPKYDYKYFRQLAIYDFLKGGENECRLCIADDKNIYVDNMGVKKGRVKWLKVPKSILKKSLDSVFEDVSILKSYQEKGWEGLNDTNIFREPQIKKETEDLI